MSTTAVVQPVRIPAWAWAVVAAASVAAYVIGLDNGALLQGLADQAHEFFHDGRHFLGMPCH